MGSGAGYESISNTFLNITRNGDTLASGVRDIRVVAGQDTALINCWTQSADAPVYDFANKRATIMGPISGTINNGGGVFKLGNQSGKIQFPGTINGAFLDYYDQGTWTASLGGSVTNPTSPITATGVWTRIGRQVFVTAEFLNVDTTGAGGNVKVTGLPFTAVTISGYGAASTKNFGSAPVIAAPLASSTQINFYLATDRSAELTHAAPGAGGYLAFSAAYIA
jgi:hypothetical protein